jgi:SOS regulatory protein LexA
MITVDYAVRKIRKFYINYKRIPSYSEMCALFNYASKSGAAKLSQRLIEEGVLEKDSSGHLLPKRLFLPLRLYGSIKAGFPSPAEDQLVDTVSFDTFLINDPESSFLLKVSGDSMIEAGINDGDVVVIDQKMQPKSGDIVVAYVDNDWTLKYFEKRNGKICLVPANPKYPEIYPKNSLSIGGVVVSSVRKYH